MEKTMTELIKMLTRPQPRQTTIQQLTQRQMEEAAKFARMVYEKQTSPSLKHREK